MDVLLYDALTRDTANTYSLVLSSGGLKHRIGWSDNGWQLWVDESIHDMAQNIISLYILENPEQPVDNEPEQSYFVKSYSGVWVSLLLIATHMTVNMAESVETVFRTYGASAHDILNGQVYRAVTALMLHADALHLLGNIAGIALFCTALCNITGSGIGWFLILTTGTLGNLANAMLFKQGHYSIGFSTCVFGAVGFLAAHQVYNRLYSSGLKHRAWLPMAAGLALLAFMGAGERSDLTAHLFGFFSGTLVGFPCSFFLNSLRAPALQFIGAALSVGCAGSCWLWALDLF